MSTFAELRARLKLVIERIARTSSTATAHVQWRDERLEQSTGTRVLLFTRSPATVGTPELRVREVLDEDGNPDPDDVGDPEADPPVVGTELKNDVVHQKTLTLQVLVECFDQTVTADELADQIRDRLYRPWSLARLREVECAIQRVEPTVPLTRVYDKRVVSVVSFDVRLAWATEDTQESFDATAGEDDVTDADTYIETLVVNDGLANEQTITLTESP